MSDAEIRQRLDSLVQAIRDKDIEALMSHYAPDVVVYDVMPPPAVQGAGAYRKNFERWFSHCLGHVQGMRVGKGKADYWVRVTTCFQKANGQWLVGHEHVSVPSESA
jgi:ketosteroid isomerase-like protein